MSLQKYLLTLTTLGLAIALGFYLGHQKPATTADSTAMVKTYKVAAAEEAQANFNRLFAPEVARAQAFANGMLVVRFPKNFEKGIDDTIANFQITQDKGNQKIRVDYWVLRASPDITTGAPNLAVLGEVIKSIDEVDGKQSYEVLEHLSTNSIPYRTTSVRGQFAEIETEIIKGGAIIDARLKFKSKFGQIESTTNMKNNEFIILGQNAVSADQLNSYMRNASSATKSASKIYYVIRPHTVE